MAARRSEEETTPLEQRDQLQILHVERKQFPLSGTASSIVGFLDRGPAVDTATAQSLRSPRRQRKSNTEERRNASQFVGECAAAEPSPADDFCFETQPVQETGTRRFPEALVN